eukprot:scaffold39952_cov31-Tisochrysis_lutea.AAC.1
MGSFSTAYFCPVSLDARGSPVSPSISRTGTVRSPHASPTVEALQPVRACWQQHVPAAEPDLSRPPRTASNPPFRESARAARPPPSAAASRRTPPSPSPPARRRRVLVGQPRGSVGFSIFLLMYSYVDVHALLKREKEVDFKLISDGFIFGRRT